MIEAWIQPNRRALALGLTAPSLLLAAAICCFLLGQIQLNWLWRATAILLGVVAAVTLGIILRLMQSPRVAYREGFVLVDCGLTDPVGVPLEVVECFFLGQAGGMIPDATGREAEVRTVIIRLAESAQEWHHRDMKAALGHWCEGYITIRGTWCEPITPELMKRLNSRLAELHREQKRLRTEVPT